ncbi:Pimeloyl-ACP methyl ester carboxylesterase OS=Castellaniella defragrans OX=75697 GN=HNR28_001898 PE=4 SV=1 [Castellaniella defragrans]
MSASPASPSLPTLVLANSLGATSEMWRDLIPVWSRHYRILQVHYAGHGPSTPESLPACDSITAMGDALLARLDAEGVRQFDYIGLSLGGTLGLDLASRHSSRVRRLVAANCRFWAGADGQSRWNQTIQRVREHGLEAIVEGTLERWLTSPFRAEHPDVVERLRRMILGTSREGYAHAATAVRDIDLRAQLEEIRSPVLLLTGDQDLAAPASHLQDLASHLSGATLRVFPHCAHLSCIEQTAAFRDAVHEHLGI